MIDTSLLREGIGKNLRHLHDTSSASASIEDHERGTIFFLHHFYCGVEAGLYNFV